MLSKTASESNNTTKTTLPLPSSVEISFLTQTKGVIVLYVKVCWQTEMYNSDPQNLNAH